MSLIRHTAAQLVGLHKTKNMKNIKKNMKHKCKMKE